MRPKNFFWKKFGINFYFKNFKKVGENYFWSENERANLEKILEKKDFNFYQKILQKVENDCENLKNWCEKIQKIKNWKNFSRTEILKIFLQHWKILKNCAAFLQIKHILSNVLEKKIREKLAEIFDKNSEKIFFKILVPTKKTLTKIADEKILELSKNFSEKKKNNFLEKFSWLGTFAWCGEKFSEKNLAEKIAAAKKFKNEKNLKPKKISAAENREISRRKNLKT